MPQVIKLSYIFVKYTNLKNSHLIKGVCGWCAMVQIANEMRHQGIDLC